MVRLAPAAYQGPSNAFMVLSGDAHHDREEVLAPVRYDPAAGLTDHFMDAYITCLQGASR